MRIRIPGGQAAGGSAGLLAAAVALLALGCTPGASLVPGTGQPGPGSTGVLATGGAPQPARSGVATGRATYSDGRPLAGANVIVIGVEYETEVDAVTDATGTYLATVDELDASYRMAAWIEVPFDGETFAFPLEPVGGSDTHFRGGDGISKDFEWRLSGPGSWASHLEPSDRRSLIGGIIGVFVYDPNADPTAVDALALDAGSKIAVTLRPLTPLIDGSTAQPITVEILITETTGPYSIGEVGDLRDIPLARYEATATATDAAGQVTNLVLGATCTRLGCPLRPSSLDPTAEIRFVPADANVHRRPFQGQPAAGLALYVQRP